MTRRPQIGEPLPTWAATSEAVGEYVPFVTDMSTLIVASGPRAGTLTVTDALPAVESWDSLTRVEALRKAGRPVLSCASVGCGPVSCMGFAVPSVATNSAPGVSEANPAVNTPSWSGSTAATRGPVPKLTSATVTRSGSSKVSSTTVCCPGT